MTQPIMRRCGTCHEYTLSEACPRCQAKAGDPRPPKYSPEDPYGEYRRKAKKLAGGSKAPAGVREA